MGTDSIIQIKQASQISIAIGRPIVSLTSGDKRCGPDGLAIAGDGAVLVWCSFTRTVQRLDFVDAKGELATAMKTTDGPTLVPTAMTAPEHDGFVLFHSANTQVSQGGALACASCHPDGRDDGLSWKIEKNTLQTPLLAGRLVGTHPYKWDGGDKDLETSLATTMKRLGGSGLDAKQTARISPRISTCCRRRARRPAMRRRSRAARRCSIRPKSAAAAVTTAPRTATTCYGTQVRRLDAA